MRIRILKQFIVTLFISSLSMAAFATAKGMYMGMMVGPATNSAANQQAQIEQIPPTVPPTTTLAKPRSKQFGSRVFIGYQINPYAGFEGGFTFFSTIHYDTKGVQTCSSPNTRVRDIDIVAKGILPFREVFDVYVKGGVAASYLTSSGAFNPSTTHPDCGRNTYNNKFSPTFSFGASYYVNQNWVLDASYNALLVGGQAGTMSMFGVGFSYHFVDQYCGQFLC